MRGPDRKEAEQAGRRHSDRQLRHREGRGQRARELRPANADHRDRKRRVRRRRGEAVAAAGRPGARLAAQAPGHRHSPGRAGDRRGDDSRAAIPALALGGAGPDRAGGRVVRAPLPRCRVGQPQTWRRHHGHPDLDRHAGGLPVVAVRPGSRGGRPARHAARLRADRRARRPRLPRRGPVPRLLRGGGRGDAVRAGRPVLRAAVQADGRRRAAGAAGAGRQGRRGAAGGRRNPHPDRAVGRRRRVRGASRGTDRHRRDRRRGLLGGGRRHADR
ncbi:hypothetical protein PICSAR164_04501 [Mycobacterium avium subsp. paratuberculosis]|nr:hypothetical protein PICSAR164_04501 [Mycobacterium avium subsp. paratuberculosis]CAG7352419.1 hypothetical protein PICSAR65_04579 [Mycobacterium avium subsp. paratuberculosis]CAG7405941.1 hypothetical protein PICSAR71_04558 [Mycobacterium avium subsp. paratuberculosis]CAG7410427.1 hypothetical protein PICSAR8_04519 [Mycobacterium avium subsp. paratuberculosis]